MGRTGNWRKGLLAKVHIGKKASGMSEAEYRNMLMDSFGVESCSDLSIRQLEELVRHLASRGVEYPDSRKQYAKKDPAKFYEIPDHDPNARQKRYLAALWGALGWRLSGLDKRCKSQWGVESFLWLNDQTALQTLGTDLVGRCRKKGIDPSPDCFDL